MLIFNYSKECENINLLLSTAEKIKNKVHRYTPIYSHIS